MKKSFKLLISLLIISVFTGCGQYDTFESLRVIDKDCARNIKEGSDLSYDRTKKILYIIGDKGDLFTCSVDANKDSIKLTYLDSKKISHNLSSIDSEGLAYVPSKNEFVVSTEGNSRNAGIYHMSLDGKILDKYTMPKHLKNATFKGNNLKFEAVAYTKEFGMITATENPVNKNSVNKQTLYSKDKKWLFQAENIYVDKNADNYIENSVVAIANITRSSKEILVLERAYERKNIGFFPDLRFIITIKKVDLGNCKYKKYSNNYEGNECESLVLNKFETSSYSGNYEGLTEINDGLFLMINDNQNKTSTVFKYFNIKNEREKR